MGEGRRHNCAVMPKVFAERTPARAGINPAPTRKPGGFWLSYPLKRASTAAFLLRTAAVSASRLAWSLAARVSSAMASISIDNKAALTAPSMATVATGMPEGIWTVDKSASIPSRVWELTGRPMTGRVVLAASAPARWAAFPAAAMMTPMPFCRAFRAKDRASAGVRWAVCPKYYC